MEDKAGSQVFKGQTDIYKGFGISSQTSSHQKTPNNV